MITENTLEGIRLINSHPVIENCIIFQNEGSGIYCENSNPTLINLILRNNEGTDGYGGGLCLFQSNPSLINVAFYENHASKGGGTYCYGSNPVFINSTFSVNTASFGSGIYAGGGSFVKIANSIIWDNTPHEIMIQGVYTANGAEVDYSNIKGGEEGVIISGNRTLNWLEGNINEDPLFAGSGEHPLNITDVFASHWATRIQQD